ncbi:MAG: hypothetical protein K0R18_43 [Bacillales bacterium]|jgi:ribosomal protein L37AE/L43A|nr:hypothetical protein [Bacillales bacterium]
MKNKKPNCGKVQYFDFTPKRSRRTMTKKHSSNRPAKIFSIMTYCQVCKKEITKKYEVNDFHLCDKCHNLTPPEIYLEVTKNDKEIQRYVNWDADLEHLYYHFWLDDTK